MTCTRHRVMPPPLFIVFVSIFLALCRVCHCETPSVGDIESRALESRRAIKSAHFQVKRTLDLIPQNEHVDDVIDTWLASDGSLREDRTASAFGTKQIFSDGLYYQWVYWTNRLAVKDRTQWAGATLRPLSSIDRTSKTYSVFNPLVLMFEPYPYEVEQRHPLDSFVGSPLRKNITIEECKWKDMPAFRITFDNSKMPLHVEYIVVPAWNYSIPEITLTGDLGINKSSADLIEISSHMWFPKSVDTIADVHQKRTISEHLEISVSDVNRPIDRNVFSWAGMALPVNTIIDDYTSITKHGDPSYKIWTGELARPMDDHDLVAIQVSAASSFNSSRRKWLLICSGVAIVAAILCFVYYERRKMLARN
ncbi:MAG TPA: hypothetical protein VM008_07655 [Phycisphaerae bacterium]|nr:hypothetical protein [Phycisphaerae bacterium]